MVLLQYGPISRSSISPAATNARRFLQCVELHKLCVVDIDKDRHQPKPWHCFDQDVLSFAVSLARKNTDACDIAARGPMKIPRVAL
jgi:hypothetical protein